MAESTRKAVVTLAQVSEAFGEYVKIKGIIGDSLTGHTFDRGNRGKGFAQYDQGDNTVRTFDTKEDALTFYGRYVEVAREVGTALGHDMSGTASESATEGTDKPEGTVGTQEGQNAPEGGTEATGKVPTQTRRRVKASQEA